MSSPPKGGSYLNRLERGTVDASFLSLVDEQDVEASTSHYTAGSIVAPGARAQGRASILAHPDRNRVSPPSDAMLSSSPRRPAWISSSPLKRPAEPPFPSDGGLKRPNTPVRA